MAGVAFSQYGQVIAGGTGDSKPGGAKGFIGWTPDPNSNNGGNPPNDLRGNANANITGIGSAGKAQAQVINTNNQ